MLSGDPNMILICTANYNRSDELIIHDDQIIQLNIDDDPSVRYLNRIGVDTRCTDDGFLQCSRYGPDRLEFNQLPPRAAAFLLKARSQITPIVSNKLGEEFTVNGGRKRNIPPLDPTQKQKGGLPCLKGTPHTLVNVRVGEKQKGKKHLVPYAHQPDTENTRLARVSTDNIPRVIEYLNKSPDASDFDDHLAAISDSNIDLLNVKIGSGVSTVSDQSKPEGHKWSVNELFPERLPGALSSTWVPVKNKRLEELSPDQLDSVIDFPKLTRVLQHVCGNLNAERKSVDHGGRCHYYNNSAVVSERVHFFFKTIPWLTQIRTFRHKNPGQGWVRLDYRLHNDTEKNTIRSSFLS